MIPGSDLLDLALTVIDAQTVAYYKTTGRELNAIGQEITSYEAPAMIVGSMQPVPRRLYEAYGLPFNRTYYTFYTSNDTEDIERDTSGDQIVYNNQRFQVESNNDWFAADGWQGVLCVLVDTVASDPTVWGFGANNYNFGNGNFLPADVGT